MLEKEKGKQMAAIEAVKEIKNGQIVGLGTGSTVRYALEDIAKKIQEGLSIQGVPTSFATQKLAEELGIPLVDTNTISQIDLTIDGADEFDLNLNLVKGGGGALLKEKIVASLSNKLIIITDTSKKVEKLGGFKLPVEIIPLALNYVQKKILALGGLTQLRRKEKQTTYLTDQGNYILDADFGLMDHPENIAHQLDHIVGVVEHGLFINMAHKIIVGGSEGIEVVLNK